MAFKGAADKEAFEAYVEHFLAPTLEEGRIVVMDRLGAHCTKRLRRGSSKRGAPSCGFCPPTGRTSTP